MNRNRAAFVLWGALVALLASCKSDHVMISGKVTGAVLAGVTVTLSGAKSDSTTTDASGSYAFGALTDGGYTVTPTLAGFEFSPSSRTVQLSGADARDVDFVSTGIGPTDLVAVPGNGQATLTWTAATGATGYDVHYSSSPAVTAADPKVSVTAPPANVTGLVNGAPAYFAVAVLYGSNASPLSATACAVPTTADTAGLTLYDGLCASVLDGKKWRSPGTYSMKVEGGAAVMSVEMGNQPAVSVRNDNYGALATVNASRVTTLQADVVVPAASAARTGAANVSALVRLLYSPPANRLEFPGANLNLIDVEVGLADRGAGLQGYRMAIHCDDASCATVSMANMAFTDPAAFVAIVPDGRMKGVAAAYDTSYTLTVSLDEGTGVFSWKIAGGGFGAGVSGTVNPGAYLAATPAWSGVPLAGAGFWASQVGVRTLDGGTGGSSGKVTALFKNVQVGLNNAAAAAFDDFSGTGGNSGPAELSLAKWFNGGASRVSPTGGSVVLHGQGTSVGAAATVPAGIYVGDPASCNTLQADLTVPAFTTSGGSSMDAFVQGRFYNDGTASGSTNSALGDVIAGVFLYPATNTVSYMIGRCQNANCSGALSSVMSGAMTGTVGTGVHTLRVKWDPAAKRFTFGFDGNNLVVDPTATIPYAGPANAPYRRILAAAFPSPTVGSAASIDAKVNNVFTAP